MAKRKIEKDYYALAKSRGFKWVGVVSPKNTGIKTLWECEIRHRWETTYSSIQQGSNCPGCYGTAKKIEKDYYSIGLGIGIKWIGKELPCNIRTKTLWECLKCGHVWEFKYNYIQQQHGCSVCTKHDKKTKKEYHLLAKRCGFKWVGKSLPKYVKDKTWWECKKGHRWKTSYNTIYRSKRCPVCKGMINGVPVSKPQRKLNDILNGSLNYPESRYRIDVAIMRRSQKIAVEYDCWYWHKGKEEHDAKRDAFLTSHGWKVLHVKARNLLPTRKQMKYEINKLLSSNHLICNLYLDDWRK